VKRLTLRAVVAATGMLAAGGAAAADQHMGVATCAGSACHGATRLAGAAVRQDEYLRWQREERHARAFATLRGERSARIAANLGLRSATDAPECLVCHADFVPAAASGPRHHLSDGIGCEACHGGAERWLTPHARGYRSHRDRTAGGLYPTWEPLARAELCLSCHQGDARRPMTHAIMGAGHPPLLFELDTFTALQPAHFEVDADYVARKGRPDDARLWIVGQAAAARGLLAGLAGPALGEALFPELAFFDCNACHHPMQPPRWQPRPGGAPGRVPVADAPLHFTALWLDAVKPELAQRWRAAILELHAAGDRAALRERAAAAGALLEKELLPLAATHAHGAAQLRALALAIADQGAGPRAGDFSIAEHTAMATAVFATALGAATGSKAPKALQSALDSVFAAVEDRERYDPGKMRAALRQYREQLAAVYK
jgi:hypothetical protein